MSEAIKNTPAGNEPEHYSLNDDRRVKVLSPGALVAKRFFRNRLAVIGLAMLVAMFVFSFVGGVISPYGQDEQFFTINTLEREYVGVSVNSSYRYSVAEGQDFGALAQSELLKAINAGEESFTYKDVTYTVVNEGEDLYSVYQGDTLVVVAAKDIFNAPDSGSVPSLEIRLAALRAYVNGETEFEVDGTAYTMDEDGNLLEGGTELGYISRFIVSSADSTVVVTRDFKEKLEEAISDNAEDFVYTSEDGTEAETQGENYIPGVYVKYGNIARFCKIDPVDNDHPLVTDGDYILVLPKGTDGSVSQVRLYDEIIVSGQNLYDGKLL